MSENSRKRRIASVVAGSLLVAGSGLVAGIAMAGSASADDSVTSSSSEANPGSRVKDFLASVLSGLVSKGTITQEQSDAITSGIDAKVAEQQKAMTEFRAKADELIAKAHGLTVEQFKAQRQAHTLTPLTDAARTALQADLQALATSLGLPADGPWMRGPGMGLGMGRDGDRGGHHGRNHHPFGDVDGDGAMTNDSTFDSATSSSYVGG